MISTYVIKSQLEWSQLKFYKVGNKKGSVKKRKTSIKRSRVFQIALKGGDNTNVAWEISDHPMLL